MPAYIEVEELASVLKIRNPSDEQTNALDRVILEASREINDYLDRDLDTNPLDDEETATAERVCLQRATELWGLQEFPLGLAGIGSEFGAANLARDSFEKYRFQLVNLKEGFGIA